MAEIIRMPKMSDTMESGIIAAWLKKVGDSVQSGDILAEIETDKATMELEVYEEGTLLHIGVKEKEAVAINDIIAIIGKPDEDITPLLAPTKTITQTPTNTPVIPAQIHKVAMESTPIQQVTNEHHPSPIFASPVAKKMAQEKGYDLSQIKGSGPGGRIVKQDIENLFSTQLSNNHDVLQEIPTAVGFQEAYEDQPVSPMRKTIAKRLSESRLTAPSFELTMRIHMDQLVAVRPQLNEYARIKITFNDIIIKAVAMAIKKHPLLNATWLEEQIRYYRHIHIGVAMAVGNGLFVPVVRFVDQLSVAQIATQIKKLNEKAKNNHLKPADWEGSTFTVSNLGMLGVEQFTAIINPPSACILAIGAIQQLPVVKENAIVPGYVMKVNLTCDHRVIDGAVGASFLQTFKELLEEPLKLLI